MGEAGPIKTSAALHTDLALLSQELRAPALGPPIGTSIVPECSDWLEAHGSEMDALKLQLEAARTAASCQEQRIKELEGRFAQVQKEAAENEALQDEENEALQNENEALQNQILLLQVQKEQLERRSMQFFPGQSTLQGVPTRRAGDRYQELEAQAPEAAVSHAPTSHGVAEISHRHSGMLNTILADAEEEMASLIHQIEVTMLELQDSVGQSEGDKMRLRMQAKMQQAHLASYARQRVLDTGAQNNGPKVVAEDLEGKIEGSCAGSKQNAIPRADITSFAPGALARDFVVLHSDLNSVLLEQQEALQQANDPDAEDQTPLKEGIEFSRRTPRSTESINLSEILDWVRCEERPGSAERSFRTEQVALHARDIQQLSPPAIDVSREVRKSEETLSDFAHVGGFFEEILRLQKLNAELHERVRKLELQLEKHTNTKRRCIELEAKASGTAAMQKGVADNAHKLICQIASLADEVQVLISTVLKEMSRADSLRTLTQRQKLNLEECIKGVELFGMELIGIQTCFRGEVEQMESYVRREHENTLLLRIDCCSKTSEVQRLSELLRATDNQKSAALDGLDTAIADLHKERQEKAELIQNATFSDKQAWIFQSRLEKEELALELAQKEDELATLQRKMREMMNTDKLANQKTIDLSSKLAAFRVREADLASQVKALQDGEAILRDALSQAQMNLKSEKGQSAALEAKLEILGKELRSEREANALLTDAVTERSDVAERFDSLHTDREALVVIKGALEKALDQKDKELERLKGFLREEQAEWQWRMATLHKEGDPRRERRLLTLAELLEREIGHKHSTLLLHVAFAAMVLQTSHARERKLQSAMETGMIQSRRTAAVPKLQDPGHRHFDDLDNEYQDPNFPSLIQLEKGTHDALCNHVHKQQFSCTNLQHRLANVCSRTEAELASALDNITVLKQNLPARTSLRISAKSCSALPPFMHQEMQHNNLGDADPRQRPSLFPATLRANSFQEKRYQTMLPSPPECGTLQHQQRVATDRWGENLTSSRPNMTPSRPHVSIEKRRNQASLRPQV